MTIGTTALMDLMRILNSVLNLNAVQLSVSSNVLVPRNRHIVFLNTGSMTGWKTVKTATMNLLLASLILSDVLEKISVWT